jgi:hypothetical protein
MKERELNLLVLLDQIIEAEALRDDQERVALGFKYKAGDNWTVFHLKKIKTELEEIFNEKGKV